jgi:hypothetical protein
MPTPATNPDAPSLAYGRRAPLHGRQWFRWCLFASGLAGLFGSSWAAWERFGVPWQRERERLRAVAQESARVEALKREWMTFREPADRVVYAEGEGRPSGRHGGAWVGAHADLPAARRAWPFAPDEAIVPTAGPPLGRLARADREVLLFLHGRQTPAGHERAVLLVAYPDGGGAGSTTRPALGRSLWFWYAMVDLAAWSGKPPPKPKPGTFARMGGPEPPHPATRGYGAWRFPPDWKLLQQPLRLFAGQPDPDDPTHFTIGYEYDGEPGTIDGYLEDGPPRGESIRFVVRDGPAAAAAGGPTPGGGDEPQSQPVRR